MEKPTSATDPTTPGPAPAPSSPEAEGKNHTYVTSRIPWFVHLLWVCYWIGAIAYVLIYLIPSLQREVLNPP